VWEVPLKVAVTGGTGFVGTAVVSELLQAGHEVRILSRKAPERLSDAVRHVPGSVVTGEGLDTLVEGVDAVIHLVGIIREKGINTFKAVHHEGTVNVIVAASRAGVSRYLHMSAMGTREGAKSRYHQTKWAGEEAVRASGLDWTIFRPSTIYGPGDSFINMLADTMRKTPVMPVLGGGWNLMQPIFVNDVAASFRAALESEIHINKTYELGGPDTFTLKQILEKVLQVIDKKTNLVGVPMLLVAVAVWVAERLTIALPVTTDQLIMLREDNVRTGGDPVEALEIEWTGFEEGIRGYLKTGNH
jgi:NADH dehydrogenase